MADYVPLHQVGFEPTKHEATRLKRIPFDQTRVLVLMLLDLLNLWSMWDLNPRPIAHKTITLPTELMDLVSFLVLGGSTVPLHRVGFEPTRTNTLQLECNPLDQTWVTMLNSLFYLFLIFFYFSFFTSIFLLITLFIRALTLSRFLFHTFIKFFDYIFKLRLNIMSNVGSNEYNSILVYSHYMYTLLSVITVSDG